MKPLFALSAIALVTCSMSSHAVVNIEPECNINVNGNMRIHADDIEIVTDTGSVIKITSQYDIMLDDEYVDLSPQQAEQAQQYYNAIHTAVPMTVDIVKDGLSIANEAITQVFGQLLGPDDDIVYDTQTLFDEIDASLNDHFYDDQGAFIVTGSEFRHESQQDEDQHTHQNGWLSQRWENEFESKVENLVEKAIGRIMVSVGTELLFGDSDADSVIGQLQNFDNNIEDIVEEKADRLEVKALELCEVLQIADNAENELQTSVAALSDLDILHIRTE